MNSNSNAIYNYKNDKNYSYQIIFLDNLQQSSNFLVDKKKEIAINIPAMRLNRDDNLKLKEKILSMTNEERKGLGINNSTPWYMKNHETSWFLYEIEHISIGIIFWF